MLFRSGKAHEILGISEQAATRTILRAFRYWVKRFHPDNARGLSPETAANNTRKLTEAKSVLLLKRKDKAA